MAKLWDDLTKWLEEASKVVGKEAGDLTLRGSLKLEIFETKRRLRDNFTEFGARVFEDVFTKKNKNWKKSRKIAAVVKRIKTTKTKLKKLEGEYKKVGKTTKRGKR